MRKILKHSSLITILLIFSGVHASVGEIFHEDISEHQIFAEDFFSLKGNNDSLRSNVSFENIDSKQNLINDDNVNRENESDIEKWWFPIYFAISSFFLLIGKVWTGKMSAAACHCSGDVGCAAGCKTCCGSCRLGCC